MVIKKFFIKFINAFKNNHLWYSTNNSNLIPEQTKTTFSCFDKFIKYLISFNKLEEATRQKLKKENPKKNYSHNNYRINIPLPILHASKTGCI